MRRGDPLNNLAYALYNHTVTRGGNPSYRLFPDQLKVFMYTSTWGDTSCGFGGMAGQSVVETDTVVIMPLPGHGRQVQVFIGPKLAYTIDKPNELFFRELKEYRLRGATDNWLEYKEDYEE